jgi:hypothetical protein
MKDDTIFFGLALLMCGLSLSIGIAWGREMERNAAVNAEAGHWSVNATNGVRAFVYTGK